MNYNTVEGNHCKDSLHAKRAINSQQQQIEEDLMNEKLERRQDFRLKKKQTKKKLAQKQAQKLKIKPHSTSLYGDFVSRLSEFDIDTASEALETVVMAFFMKAKTTNIQKALFVSAKLLKTHLGVSYGEIISKILLCKDMSFVKGILSWSLEDLESYMKELLNNWKLAHKNEAFGSLVALVSTFLAIFYSAEKKWSISLGSFSMFLFDAKNSCKGATTLVDALLKVSTYVIGGLKKYLINGSLTGFLYSDDQLGELDSTVSQLQAQFKFVKPGNLGKFTGLDENAFDQQLQLAICSGEKLVLLYDGPTKKFVMDKVRMLRQLHCDFIQTRAAGGLRVSPFAYLLAGSTGLGKSSINEILMRYILSSNGFNHQDPYIVTLNSQDKYFSTYRSYINGVIFDDFANVNHEFVEDSPCDTLLKFVNNIPYYLNMAELELKGNVVAEPKVVGITTNVSDIDSSVYSNQPSSIMRRLKVHIYASVRPEFQKEGSIEIDSSKVQKAFGDSVLAPDIWLFDVYVVKVVPVPRPPKIDCNTPCVHRDDKWFLQYVQWNGREMKGATINELLLYVKEATALHYKEQNALIERSKMYGGDIICNDCKSFFEHCTCLPPTLDEANSSIEDIIAIGLGNDIGEIEPQSSINDLFYSKIFEARQTATEQSLKEMLFSWIVEGKCNLESVCAEFIASCSQEIQYFLIVARNLAEKWVRSNRKLLLEICFPHEFEGTRIGDYYSLVARGSEVRRITNVSCLIEATLRIGLLSVVYSLHYSQSFLRDVRFIIPIIGHYVISRMSIPSITTRIYAEGLTCVKTSRGIFEKLSPEVVKCVFASLVLLKCSQYGSDGVKENCQLLACFMLIIVPCISSFKNVAMKEAPRALSLLYKREKENLVSDWTQMAPALLTMSTLYYSKNDIMDFYVDACDKWSMKPQSRLKPTISEIAQRDEKHRFDADWFKNCAEPFLDPLPTSISRTSGEVRLAIGENVWSVHNLDTGSKSNCLVLCSGCILIPYHYVPRSMNSFRFTRHNRGNSGNSSFDAFIEPEQCIRVKNLDLAMLWMPKTRDVRNLIEFFPVEFHETKEERCGRIATRDFEGCLEWSDVRELTFTKTATSGLGYFFPGIGYIWNGAKEGKCLSPIVTDDKRACISGLHIGGSTQCRTDGGFVAFGVTPTQSDLLETKMLLERFATVIPMSAPGDFRTECMGIEVLQRNIKKKSCYLRMERANSAYFLGSSLNCNRTPKSQVRDTPIKERVKIVFDVKENWGSPKFKGSDGHTPHQPWEAGMEKWIVDKPGLPFGLLNKSKIEYSNNLTRVLCNEKTYWTNEIRVLTWDETVNGIPGKRFIDSMNFSSSIGFPFTGCKKNFSTNLGKVGIWQDKRILNKEFIEEAEKIEDLYKQGKRYYPWFTSTLKDEPTLVTKDKVRVFQATSTPFQLVMRKYTLGICRFLQMNPLESECAVGIDPCSSEWNEMYNHLKGIQTPFCDKWFAIDYKAYDTSIPSQMIMAVGRIFVDIGKIAGYNEEEVRILYSIFSELAFSVVDFNGDVLMLDGANPSGNSLTVFINSLCNSLLMRIYFYYLYPRRRFSTYIRMMSYGDDLIAAVNATAGGYTMKGYASYLSQFGFVVTPAQKDAELQSFSKLKEIDFLKRKFVWSDDYGSMIAPLEEASIYKRLCNYMTSETSVEVIVGANVDGALDEWAFYGEATYLDRQEKLIKIVDEFGLHRFIHRLYMTYEQRVSLWKQNNADPAVMGKGQSMDTDQLNCDSNWLGFFGWGNIISKMGIGGPPHSHNSGSISSNDQLSINLRTTNTQQNNSLANTENLPVYEELIPCSVEIVPHSLFTKIKEETMTLVDGSSNQVVDIPRGMDETRMANDSTDNSLAEFLSRPVKVLDYSWTVGTSPGFQFNPWNLFFSNKRVSNKVATYMLMRGTMKVKFVINGNSFFYGRLMVSYQPLHTFDAMTVDTSVNPLATVQLSQMPRIFLDPTTSQGGEMTLPFFWHFDYLSLVSDDITKLGQFHISELAPLKHTTGGVSINHRVTITAFAWMEDTQLEAPTSTNPSFIVPQSTGFSPPSQYLVPKGCSTTVLVDAEDTVNKITLKKDQYVSVAPDVVGLGKTNELNIASIASTESVLAGFTWPQSALAGQFLYNVRVTPAQYNKSFVGGIARLHFTASCGAVLPFKYWNGTFNLRLQFIASAFHRGRVAVVYDPYKSSAVREDNAVYTQIVDIATCRDVTFSVGPNQDRTMLTYGLPDIIPPAGALYTENFGSTPLLNSDFGNGTISIYVLNELTTSAPSTTINNDISVVMHVSMGEDFQVFVPSGNFARYMLAPPHVAGRSQGVEIQPQSTGVVGNSSELDVVQNSEPIDTTTLSLDQYNAPSNKRLEVYIGERVESFQELLKRYNHWASIRISPTGTALIATQFLHKSFPAYKGAAPNPVHSTSASGTPKNYNFFGITMLNYLAPAFQGWRGSIRYKLFYRCVSASRPTGIVTVSQRFNALYDLGNITYDVSSVDKAARSSLAAAGGTTRSKGSLILSQAINPVVEYELPWFEITRFCPGKVYDWTGYSATRDIPDKGANVTIDGANTAAGFYDVHVASGKDFNFYFFTGWPPMVYSDSFPDIV